MSTYTTNLGLEKIAPGDEDGVWGDSLNLLFDMADQAISGVHSETLAATGSTGTPNDIAITDGALSDGRNFFIDITDGGDLGATCYVRITPNDAEKIGFFRNSLSGSRDVVIFQGTYSAANTITLEPGKDAILHFDGGGSGAVVTSALQKMQMRGILNSVTTAITANTTAVAGNRYYCDTQTTGAFTLTLPASPTAGDQVAYCDYGSYFSTNNLTIGRNSENIRGAASDLTINTLNDSATLEYTGATEGWVTV